ncbi:hypothetical protein [Micromonospora sp. NPDC049301]|uniref:hypothetical protein n=1 Tax=Micromonospora sp. NPDC049301 TaxID=3155723 RepID=UPI003438F90C
MGIQIPGELSGLLNELGYLWPESDEERLFELGQAWIAFGAEADRQPRRPWPETRS